MQISPHVLLMIITLINFVNIESIGIIKKLFYLIYIYQTLEKEINMINTVYM